MSSVQRNSLEASAAELFAAAGILAAPTEIPANLHLYCSQADAALAKARTRVDQGGMTAAKARQFQELLVQACDRVLRHPIIAENHYLARFAKGVDVEQARHEVQQFSVFAIQFNAAQAQLVANAPTLEAYHERLNVLLNEEGIPYQGGFEGDLTGNWNIDTVHFTWLRNMAQGLGLGFEDIGKIWVALPGTKAFVEATFKYYASIDQNVAAGASFAIENWAANSLWEPWIAGMKVLNATLEKPVGLGYLTYHASEERHHSQATLDELLENFMQPWFQGEKFLEAAQSILSDGVQAYYESQLETLPGKDGGDWPPAACGPG